MDTYGNRLYILLLLIPGIIFCLGAPAKGQSLYDEDEGLYASPKAFTFFNAGGNAGYRIGWDIGYRFSPSIDASIIVDYGSEHSYKALVNLGSNERLILGARIGHNRPVNKKSTIRTELEVYSGSALAPASEQNGRFSYRGVHVASFITSRLQVGSTSLVFWPGAGLFGQLGDFDYTALYDGFSKEPSYGMYDFTDGGFYGIYTQLGLRVTVFRTLNLLINPLLKTGWRSVNEDIHLEPSIHFTINF